MVRGWWMKSSAPPAKKADETTADEKKTATPAELAAIMAEVQQLGTLDPAAQNALLEDLKRTDPALWPQLVQTFRASIAYRRQMEERARLARGQNPQSGLARRSGIAGHVRWRGGAQSAVARVCEGLSRHQNAGSETGLRHFRRYRRLANSIGLAWRETWNRNRAPSAPRRARRPALRVRPPCG